MILVFRGNSSTMGCTLFFNFLEQCSRRAFAKLLGLFPVPYSHEILNLQGTTLVNFLVKVKITYIWDMRPEEEYQISRFILIT